MNLRKLIFTNSDNYKAKSRITPKGIMVHSTGANNPELRRYVGPDDGLLGKNLYNNHWNQPMSRRVGVHAFIGKLADGTIATYQTLPWTHRAWHAGGKANDTHIGFEICEDGLTSKSYFDKVYQEAVDFCAFLCTLHELDPLGKGVIIGHYEGYKLGLASNHGDPDHWFKRHGKSMDTFRADVKRLLSDAPAEKITTGGVNLRTAPSVFYEIVRKLGKGTRVTVFMTLGSWSYVKAGDSVGYLHTSYMGPVPEPVPEPIPELPPDPPPEAPQDHLNGPYEADGIKLWFRSVAGSYDTRRAAENTVEKLKAEGYTYAWLQAVTVDGQPWFRAHAGSHDRRGPAEAEVQKLISDGYKGAWMQATYTPIHPLRREFK